jgi:hypothetical protein
MQSVRPIANRRGHSEDVRITARRWSRNGGRNLRAGMVTRFQVLHPVQILRRAAVYARVCAPTTMRQQYSRPAVAASRGYTEMGECFGR